jgi:poly-gamma-glutamate synthesis protein (capsule biosynthesis protein)
MVNIALSGGCIINRQFSNCTDERFLSLVDVLRKADVSFSHLEGTITGTDEKEVFPAAEAGWTWIRTPAFFAEELKWAGFNIVSHASNHCMDFMYGGLYSTWSSLKQAGVPFAGTGTTLTEARRPAYFDSGKTRVALISSSSSTPDWARAADAMHGTAGRPGANQIRTYQALERSDYEAVKHLARKTGTWFTEVGNQLFTNPAGLHNTVTRYALVEKAEDAREIADQSDVEANLRMIREARKNTNLVIFHIHNHEWNPRVDLATPPDFIRTLAHQCIDAGADIFIAEGAHALLRGIEIYRGKPIFYDPGDLFKDGNSKIRPLSEYYWVQGRSTETGALEITTIESQIHTDIGKVPVSTNPPGGYNTGKVLGVLVPVCSFDEDGTLREIRIYPGSHLKDSPAVMGLPGLETGAGAKAILEYVAELSAPYGTTIELDGDIGLIRNVSK